MLHWRSYFTLYCTIANCRNFSSCSTLAIIHLKFLSFLGQLYCFWTVKWFREVWISLFRFFVIFVNPLHSTYVFPDCQKRPRSPQMGWNVIHRLRCHPLSGLYSRLPEDQWWIFHSLLCQREPLHKLFHLQCYNKYNCPRFRLKWYHFWTFCIRESHLFDLKTIIQCIVFIKTYSK